MPSSDEISGENPYDWFFLRERRIKFKPAEIALFRYLVRKRDKEATMKELCDIMPPSTVSVTVNALQEDGFIEKVPKMASDGSLYTIRLLIVPKEVRLFIASPARREVNVNSAYFMQNVENFQRLYRFVEADTKRELEGIDTHFIIDFSEVHDFLHPDEDYVYPSIGWVIYMFSEKSREDNYVFPPPAAWEMLHHLERTAQEAKKYSDFRTLTEDSRMKRFLNVIKNPSQTPELAYQELVEAYKGMKELSGLVILSDRELVKRLFHDAINRFKDLVAQGTLVPLSSILDDPYKYSVDSDVYMKVLEYLMWRRFQDSEKNVVDAMNMGLTYRLTNSLYKSDNQFFVLVTHSKRPLEIFYDVKWTDDPEGVETLVREPLFMTARTLLEKEIPDLNRRIDYVTRGKDVTSYLWENRDLLDYSKRFTQAFELDGERIIKEELTPIAKLLSQIKWFEKDYAPQIQRILNINVERIKQLNKIIAINQAKKIEELLQDQKEYTERMIEAHDSIVESVKETYSVLRNFVNVRYKHLLTPDMIDWLTKLDKQP